MIQWTPTFPSGRGLAVGAAMFLLAATSAASAADTVSPQEAGGRPAAMTGAQADAILQELKEIRKLLESIDKKGLQAQAPRRPPVPQTAKVSVKDAPALGSADAPVTVVEFTDYQCPFCLRFIQNTFPKLKEQFIDTGKVRWMIRDMPLAFHKNALKAAQAAHCAGEQGKFWEMRGVLFANAKKLEQENLPKYAQTLGLDTSAFSACLESDRYLAGIDASIQEAAGERITGTPTFVVGKASSDSVQGARIVGARDYKVFEEQIRKALE